METLVINGRIKRFNVVPTKGDGSCFFQSLSVCLWGSSFKHQEIREMVVRYVTLHWHRFQNYALDKYGNPYPSAKDYETDMKNKETYGTYCEVQAASEFYRVALEVYYKGELIYSIGQSRWPLHRLRFTGTLDEGHFEPLKEVVENVPAQTTAQILNKLCSDFGIKVSKPLPVNNEDDSGMIQSLSQLSLSISESTSSSTTLNKQGLQETGERSMDPVFQERPAPSKVIAKMQKGRPEKTVVHEKPTPQKNVAKKPRGRPRKINLEDTSIQENSTPPKKVANKQRGRPKKTVVHEKPTPQKIVAKKPRGRPRKINLSPAKAVDPNIEDSELNDIVPLSASDGNSSSNEETIPQRAKATESQNKSKKKLSALESEKRRRESKLKWTKTNPEANRKAVGTYSQSHPEVNRQAVARYSQAHPDVNRQAVARYSQAHPDVNRQAVARYSQAHPDVNREAVRRNDPDNEKRKGRQNKLWLEKEESGFNYDPDIDYKADATMDIGGMTVVCKHCKALKWKQEWPTLCCGNGKVQIPLIEEPPSPMYELLTGSHPMRHHFFNNIRKYNSAFQMTSFGAKEIHEGGFMPTFKVQGQVYHRAGSLLPDPNDEAKFLQIFFVGDEDKEANIRQKNFCDLKPDLIRELQRMLHLHNAYVQDFKVAIDSVPKNTKDFRVVIKAEKKPLQGHPGQFNAPQVKEVAILVVGETFEKRDIVLKSRDNTLQRISELHRSYDTLQYPLIFCRGEDGYCINIPQKDPDTKQPLKKTVSAVDFYSHHLMIRENSYNHLSHFGSLLNQFVVDMYAKVESERLNFIRHNQKKLRAENYLHLQDAIKKADANMPTSDLGQMVILPSSFVGSPRYMHQRTQDAMTYVRKYGAPDLFITLTCNPKWTEIVRELLPGQKAQDRYDIVNRVFNLKVKNALDLIDKGRAFGEKRCYMYSVEWQKRGLPHVHLLAWFKKKIKPDQIDQIVCAEIPDPDKDPELHELVKTHMIHGPCGNPGKPSVCLVDGKCSKRFPKPFVAQTQTGNDGYPMYRRRSPDQGGFTAKILRDGQEITVDNRWVVPYNPVLLRCFQAHMNVEICTSVKSISYICKYVNKGSDMATFGVKNENDEIDVYLTGRYISSSEAVWRIYCFPIHDRYPAVFALAVHLENGQRIYFNANDDLAQKLSTPPTTTLLQFFEICKKDDFAKTICYPDVPSYYVWRNNAYHRRKQGEPVDGWPGVKRDACLGRVYTVHPNNAECFYLRILLHVVSGPTSFEFLKTVNGILHPTFQSACKALGLLEDDDHWDKALEEAALLVSAHKLRELFTVMLVFCSVSDPASLWEKYKEWFAQDILRQERIANSDMMLEPSQNTYNQALILLEDLILSLGGKFLKEYGLPEPQRSIPVSKNAAYDAELNYDVAKLADFVQRNEAGLTNDQRKVYREILSSIQAGLGKVFFLDAPGGTGKTFLINLLLAKVRMGKKIAIASASSGIAATLLEGGKTAHSAFKLPLNLGREDSPICNISKQSSLAKILKDCVLIVWDECTMSHKRAAEALNRTLQDLRNNNAPMGGVTVLFAGDFRQTLPVIPRGTRADEVNASLKLSAIWRFVNRLSLSTNMRVHLKGDGAAGEFADILLKLGNGLLPEINGTITIPDKMAVIVNSSDELIDKIYPNVASNLNNVDWLCERAILAPKNDSVTALNDKILESFQALEREYKSVDTVLNTDDALNYPVEVLNSQTPPGIPPHRLKLKVGAPIMLLRNLNPPRLCNGTRLQVKSLQPNVIQATIFTGCGSGETVIIPRIPMIPTDFCMEFKRLQFPVRVCFAMTINKSQGQSLKFAGVDLSQSCFSHGQLYVACSRVSKSSNLFIHAPKGETVNVVYKEALTDTGKK